MRLDRMCVGPAPCRRGCDVTHFGRRGQKHRLHLRAQRAVHPRHLHLVIQVGAVAQAADQQRRAMVDGRIDHQVGEGDHLQPILLVGGKELARNVAQHLDPLFEREHRGLAGMHPDRHHHPVGDAERMREHVEVAVGDRIERAGIERYSHGSAVALEPLSVGRPRPLEKNDSRFIFPGPSRPAGSLRSDRQGKAPKGAARCRILRLLPDGRLV